MRECYSTWSESYYRDYYGPDADYPPVHQELVARILDEAGAVTVLDAGCGPASLLRGLDAPGRVLHGFDLTPEMVTEAQRALCELGHPEERIWQGSVTDPDAFRCPTEPSGRFDAALCCGVLPHVPHADEAAVLGHMHAALRPGGTAIVEARNALFGLFTLNRYSWELMRDELVRPEHLRALAHGDEIAALDEAIDDLRACFRTDQPPLRRGGGGEPGYDEVLSRAHQPLVLADALRDAGFARVRLMHYHYHALPPMIAARVPDLARRASIAMEDPDDPRGLVMASAFLAVGVAE